MQNDVGQLIVTCPCEDEDCEWTGPLKQRLVRHCLLLFRTCQHPNCEVRWLKSQIEAHEADCAERPVVCDFCAGATTAGALEDHRVACAFRPVTCDCGLEMPFNQLSEHHVMMQCELSHLGCCG